MGGAFIKIEMTVKGACSNDGFGDIIRNFIVISSEHQAVHQTKS